MEMFKLLTPESKLTLKDVAEKYDLSDEAIRDIQELIDEAHSEGYDDGSLHEFESNLYE